jgi:hypothetical protein
MKDIVINLIQVIIGAVFIIALVIGLVKCSMNKDEKTWNNGCCECGGHWKYEQAVGHQYRTSYIYKCDKCGKHIELYQER